MNRFLKFSISIFLFCAIVFAPRTYAGFSISKQQHLYFDTKGLSFARIYYQLGNVKDSSISRKIFAIEGQDDIELRMLGIDTMMDKMFANLKTAPVDFKKHQMLCIGIPETSELISITWQYSNDRNLYRFDMVLRDPAGPHSWLYPYVQVSVGPDGNNQVSYYLKKENAPVVEEILNYWARKDWGTNYLANP
jgi:hypothetical protein